MRGVKLPANFLGDHFADARVGGGLESLGRADEYRMRLQVRPHGAIHLARMGRRHHSQHDVRPGEGFFQRAGDFNFRGQFETGQIDFVDALGAQKFHDVGAVGPQREPVRPRGPRQRDGQRRAPAPAADDGNFLHDFLRRISKRGSVPIMSRSMFQRCFKMIRIAASSVPVDTATGGAWPGA